VGLDQAPTLDLIRPHSTIVGALGGREAPFFAKAERSRSPKEGVFLLQPKPTLLRLSQPTGLQQRAELCAAVGGVGTPIRVHHFTQNQKVVPPPEGITENPNWLKHTIGGVSFCLARGGTVKTP